ncbi:MAG: type I 3-dehydroquinate dehydratase [Acidobacteriota bacterium]|nr:type I 3-dehydroquinate dehydratase [Acidobacteriota bacterium]
MGFSQLCITVAAPTMAELRRRRDLASGAGLVEMRLDAVDRPDVAGALEGRRGPVLVTCRPSWEGGAFTGSEQERLSILEGALAAGAEYVDVEWKALTPTFAGGAGRDRLVVSMHEFSGMPDDLEARVDAMSRSGAGTVKVAVMARRLTDCLPLLTLAARRQGPTIALAMGEAGVASRVLAARFGSPWTYAGDDTTVAPGQMTARRMLEEFGFDRLGPDTAVYGVLGRPISHSISPALHNAAFRALGSNAVYLPLAADSFDDFTTFAQAMDLRGASVTAPFKGDAFELAGATDEVGRRARSVNTLRRTRNTWTGRNTDLEGFMAPLLARAPLQAARVTVLGAGGVARTVAVGLAAAGARVTVAARRALQAESLAETLGVAAGPWPPRPGSWDILVNATPVGTHPEVDRSPVPAADLDGRLVYDLVYNPPRTRLLVEAARRGCDTLGGLDMLIAQARAQCAWWTGTRPADHTMREAALARLSELNTL